jgi:hypothetical protein
MSPKNIGTIEQGERAKTETAKILGENAFRGTRPLRKADKRLLERGEPEIYVYNVSTIFQWSPRIQGRGNVIIQKCKPGQKVSEPLVIPGVMIRDYDAGNRNRQAYTEEGIDIAEDILGCSKEMPGLPQNDLTGYGCFYLVGEKFEDLSPTEQEKILSEANAKHDRKCHEKVLEADGLAGSEVTRRWISDPYRLAALHLSQKNAYRDGDKSMLTRTWVGGPRSGALTPVSECVWCGYEHKKGLAVCPNCKNILNQELFDKLSKASKKAQAEA